MQNDLVLVFQAPTHHQQADSWPFEQICHCLLVRSERRKEILVEQKSQKLFLLACLFCFLLCAVCVDTLVVIDSSRGTQKEHNWLTNLVNLTEAVLVANEIGSTDRCRNRYALVEFAHRAQNQNGGVRALPTGEVLVTKDDFPGLASQTSSDHSGRMKDGYEALAVGMQRIPFRRDRSVLAQAVLITDEERFVTERRPTISQESLLKLFRAQNVTLHVVINNTFQANSSQVALGVSSGGKLAYIEEDDGWFKVEQSSIIFGNGFARTRNYTDMAIAAGGSAWDISNVRRGGKSQKAITYAMASAFTEKVMMS